MFDFIELFDELTLRVHRFLGGFRHVTLNNVQMCRAKDREDPSNPRNYKIIVPIQYQETVHCIAYLFSLLAHLPLGLEDALSSGVQVSGNSELYRPPNPQDYPIPVDGKLDADVRIGKTSVQLHTNFKAGAALTKRRIIEGEGDGKPFRIEAEHLEGHKYLIINDVRENFPPDADAYHQVLERSLHWTTRYDHETLTTNLRYPNASFAWYTYLLSAMLWDSCAEMSVKEVASAKDLWRYAPQYPIHYARHTAGDTH